MLKRRSDMNLRKKTLGAKYSGELRQENFYGDFSSMAQIFGEIHCRHPAFAELTLYAVSISECGCEAFGRSCHGEILYSICQMFAGESLIPLLLHLRRRESPSTL